MLHETKLESGENMIIVHSAFPTSLTVESNGHLSSQAEQAKYAQCNTVTFAAPAAIAPAGLLFSSVMTFLYAHFKGTDFVVCAFPAVLLLSPPAVMLARSNG